MLDTEYRRRLEHPWWCKGDPLLWTDEGIGIAPFAEAGKVGLFNLSWWLLGRVEPPPAAIYRNTPLIWAIMKGPAVKVDSRTLIEHAAMLTQDQFQDMVIREALHYSLKRFEGQGIKAETLIMLATRKSTTS
jgi:hypothetical protein